MMEKIFLVTVFQKITKSKYNSNLHDFGDRRCVGWFKDKNEAEFSIENNINNIHDGLTNIYNYAIIEEIESGIMPVNINSSLYEWKNNKYEKIYNEPITNKYCNFGIG